MEMYKVWRFVQCDEECFEQNVESYAYMKFAICNVMWGTILQAMKTQNRQHGIERMNATKKGGRIVREIIEWYLKVSNLHPFSKLEST
jgi:hypothetical protein